MRRLIFIAACLVAVSSALADPTIWLREGWKTDFDKLTVDPSEIVTLLQRNRIAALNAPKFVRVGEETTLADREPVISLVVNGEARAYPLRIMIWHEIVNDEIAGVPVAVTYCPLCNSSIVFEAAIDGERLAFRTTGKLRNSDLIMYDLRTESWWQQFSGEAIAGAHAGRSLKMIPSRLDSWARFKDEHPDGKVLVPNSPALRDYWLNPYDGYDSAPKPYLFSGTLPDGIPALERVVLVRGESPFAIALPLLVEVGEIRQGDVVVSWTPGQASALDTIEIASGRDVGNVEVVRMVDGAAEAVVHDVTFAFVVNAFEPTVVIRTE